MSNELFRRQFLKAGVGFIAGTGSTFLVSDFAAVLAQPNGQNEWRYCGKCHGMFYNGYPDKGRCAAGGGHEAIGYNFVLPHDIPGTPTAQNEWRYCGKCHGMFYNGYPDKGRCAAGGGHEAIGYNFVLPHDIPGIPTAQNEWRYCGKCHGMFYNGYPDKGRCAAGGGHEAIGYNFVLPRQLDLVFNTRLERHQLGSWVHMSGKGFTPGGEVRFAVEDLAGASGAKSIGIFTTVKADGTFSDLVWDGRTWSRGGTANLRAIDKASGQSITTPIPALY